MCVVPPLHLAKLKNQNRGRSFWRMVLSDVRRLMLCPSALRCQSDGRNELPVGGGSECGGGSTGTVESWRVSETPESKREEISKRTRARTQRLETSSRMQA